MAKEQFLHSKTTPLFQTLEEITRRSGVSRGQAFENLLQAIVAALAAETMEPQYFAAINDHTSGPKGKRGVDLFPKFLAQVVDVVSDHDVLGGSFPIGDQLWRERPLSDALICRRAYGAVDG